MCSLSCFKHTVLLLDISNCRMFIELFSVQLYTVDHFLRTLVMVSYATLNIFVESGTERLPISDTGVQVKYSNRETSCSLMVYLVIDLVQPHWQIIQPVKPRPQWISPRKRPCSLP